MVTQNTQSKTELLSYSLDTRWACGLISVSNGIIVQPVAPIFKRFIGQRIDDVKKSYNVIQLKYQP